MKKILKILTIAAVLLTTAIVFASCKQFLEDPEEFLGYWSSEVVPIDFSIDKATQKIGDVECIPSASPVTLTIKLHNPRKFSLVMPTSVDAGKVISFPGFPASQQPAYGTDYTLEQTPDKAALKLTYKPGFLKKYEWGTGNISPEITLTSTDGRKFNKKFSLNLKADTAPKLSSSITIGKTANPIGGKYYYVIILKAEDMAETAGTGSSAGKRQKDIEELSVTGGDSAAIAFTSGNTAFEPSGRLLASTEVVHLSGDETSPAVPSWNPALNNDSWALRYRTDTEVKTARKNYTFTLIDEAGLKSSDIHVSTPATKAEAAKLSYNSNDISIQAGNPSSPYLISTESSITVKAKTETTGATIRGTLFKKESSTWRFLNDIDSSSNTEVDIMLTAPSGIGSEIEYQISLTVKEEGFADSDTKVFYVKVRKGTVLEINSTDSGAWTTLKTEVERSSGGPDIIKITGKIKAPGSNNQINVSRIVKIMGSNKNTAILDADNETFIFNMGLDGVLTLEKLTLQNGKNSDIDKGGGAIYSGFPGELTAVDVIIKDCEAKNGGGIYVHNNGNIILIDTEIKGCTAEADGGGVYVGVNGTFKMHGGTIKNNMSTLGKGVYVQGSTGGMYIYNGEFIMGGEACVGKWESNGTLQDGNDVYLDVDMGSIARIKIDKGKPITKSKAACITPKSYGAGETVLMMSDTSSVKDYVNKFTVTPETTGGSTQTWSIDDNGQLTSHTKVRYDQLEAFLTSPQVSSTAINRIEITGEIPQNHFDGSSSGSGELNKRIKKAGSKKLALKLPAGISGVTSMENCFAGCGNLVSLENIPSGVTNMKNCFLNCTGLTTAPSIPDGVMNMEGCFRGCNKLITAPTIPDSVKNMKECFLNCTGLTTIPGISNSVTDMESCFRGCKELTTGPDIPSSVTNMNNCFLNCIKLKGVKINRDYYGCNFADAFHGCSGLNAGGIKVPSIYLQNYKDNAGTMGTSANKFSAITP